MNEFNKWAEAQKGLIKYDEITSKAAKLAWKAALEWVLKNLEEEFELSADGDTGWSGGFIEEELKGE